MKNFFTTFFTALSDPKSYLSFKKEVNMKAMEQVFFNTFGGKTSFKAVVLPQDLNVMDALDSYSSETKGIRVRPINIHDFMIPEPCSVEDLEQRKKIIAMHPVAYPQQSFPVAGGSNQKAVPIGTGMIVDCFFSDGPAGGKLRGLTYTKTNSYTNTLDLSCFGDVRSKLKQLFELPPSPAIGNGEPIDFSGVDIKPKSTGRGSNKKQDSSFSGGKCPESFKNRFKDLERRPVTWFYKYDEQAVVAAMVKTNAPIHVQLTMFAFVGNEQPNYNFPNNNPAGIQTDGGLFGGTTIADYDFQTCYRDSKQMRAFAGFNTLEKAMLTYSKILEHKFSKSELWIIFDETTPVDDAAAYIADAYRSGWTGILNAKQLARIRKGLPIVKGGETIEIDWKGKRNLFKQRILEYKKLTEK